MEKLAVGVLWGVLFLSSTWIMAQDADQSSSDSGVLVSSGSQDQGPDQANADKNGNSSLSENAGRYNSGHHKNKHEEDSGSSATNTAVNNSAGPGASKPADDIVNKATDAVIFQMTANLKLTQDQITAARPVVANNIAKTRDLQQNLEDGNIDGKTMYSQRQQLIDQEYQQLGSVLTPDQLKLWVSIQNDQ